MRRCRGAFRWSLALVLCFAGGRNGRSQAAGNQQESQEFTIRTTSRLVLLDVSVKDSAGGLVSGLTKQNFQIYEDGKLQQITQFAHADIPVTVGLVVDESGSMRQKQPEVITAALAFIHASNPEDEVFVINFNEKARRGLPDIQLFSDDIEQLRAALWRGVPEGRTALYDAIEMALHQLDFGRRDKKTLVVISDGGDNISTRKLPDVMQEVMRSVATIYTIGIFDEDDPDQNPGVLNRIARLSGGSAYFPEKLSQIGQICREIAKEIRTRYTIGYIPAAEQKTAERHIKVMARSENGQKLVVRTRTSYMFTPDTQQEGLKMKVRLLRKRPRSSPGRIGLRELELFFLLFGLVALDVYIWINASTAIYQTYDKWAFDRRLPPALSVPKIPPTATLKLPEAKPIGPSGVIGRLKIPSLHLTAMIREGADAATLRRAVGHIPGTALPGGMGNVGLAGHRDTFFRSLRNIRANDPIEFEAQNGTYRYVVESIGIVGPRDVRVLASSNAESLTLVTCYPFYYVGSAPKRFVVRAVLVSNGLERPPAPGS